MNENVDLDDEILAKISLILNKSEDETDNCAKRTTTGRPKVVEGEKEGESELQLEEDEDEEETTTAFVRNNHKKSRKKYKLYDLEKSEVVKNEEVLFINGTEITLRLPEERALINNCLLTGKIDDFDLLRRILENSGLSILPQLRPNVQPVVTTNLNIKQVDVLEESIRIKKVNKNGDVVEVNDKYVTTNSNESIIERVEHLPDPFKHPRGLRNNHRRPPFDGDDDNEDEIRLKIFQNIIEEDSGIQDEYLERLSALHLGPEQAQYVNSNSLDDFYSTDLSTNSSISSDYFLKNLNLVTNSFISFCLSFFPVFGFMISPINSLRKRGGGRKVDASERKTVVIGI